MTLFFETKEFNVYDVTTVVKVTEMKKNQVLTLLK